MYEPLHLLLYVMLGGLLGALGGLFGLGGGLIAIPVLGVFLHFDQQHAQGTSLAMVAPNVMVGLWSYTRHRAMDRRVAIVLGACAVTSTYLGAFYATHVAGPGLRYAFAAYLALIAIVFAYQSRGRQPVQPRPARLAWGWTAIVGAIGGIVSGMFSVGGAVFAVPLLTTLFGFTQVEAQGLSLALVAPGTLVGIGTYALAGDVDWRVGIPLALGGIACVRFGVALAHRLSEATLRLLFCALLAGASLGLFLTR